MKPIEYTRDAARALRRMPANVATLIIGKIEQYAANPASLANNVKALKGRHSDFVRLRVGDWRVLMSDGVVLRIEKIAPRGGVYD